MPGVTAGVAAPAYAGIPVTHRDDASAVAFVTGHEDPEKPETALDWEALARFPGTLVLYMGVKNLPLIAERLVAAGRDPAEPAAAVERGTQPGQRTVTRDPRRAARGGRRRPALRRPGDPALRPGRRAPRGDRLARAPPAARQAGRRHPRPRPGQRPRGDPARARAPRWSSCRRSGSSRGSTPADVRDAVSDLHTYALVCLTSPNGVRLLFEAMAAQGRDARALANATVAAIGPGTAAALAERGVIADIVPERFVAEALVEALAGGRGRRPAGAGRPRRRGPRRAARRARRARRRASTSWRSTRRSARTPEPGGGRGGAGRPTTSPSPRRRRSATCSTRSATASPRGPASSRSARSPAQTARELGLEVHVEAERHDLEGLVEALVADAAG